MTTRSHLSLDPIALRTPLPSDVKRLTCVMIDGNSVVAVAGQMEGKQLRILGIEHRELEKLVEVTRRLHHPIFMDVDACLFVEKDLISRHLKEMLSRSVFNNPTLVIVAPDKFFEVRLKGPSDKASVADRRSKLLSQYMPINPFDYPSAVVFQELKNKNESGSTSTTRLIRMRLADVIPLVDMVKANSQSFIGLASSMTASAQIITQLKRENPHDPVVLCDVGKLRTLYTTLMPDGSLAYNAIPVGLARDNQYYFKSIPPRAEALLLLESKLGSLMFPPDATPGPLFSGRAGGPQVECTRLGVQLARYALRTLESNMGLTESPEGVPGTHYLSGRGSLVPGIRNYMEVRLGTGLRRLDKRPLPGIVLEPTVRWPDVADNLLPVGGLLEAFIPTAESCGMITPELNKPPLKNGTCTVAAMKLDTMYVFEHRTMMSPR